MMSMPARIRVNESVQIRYSKCESELSLGESYGPGGR
jgi:hypothetical protein